MNISIKEIQEKTNIRRNKNKTIQDLKMEVAKKKTQTEKYTWGI